MAQTKLLSKQEKHLNNALYYITHKFDNVTQLHSVYPKVISTGISSLDKILGINGLPRGYVSEIYGATSVGKTTLALQIIANLQKHGGTCAYIDAEYALNARYVQNMHINIKHLLLSRPSSEEQCLQICSNLIHSNAVDLIVIDSVASLVPLAEQKHFLSKPYTSLQSRILAKWLKQITPALRQSNTALLLLNQTRMKVGVVFGSPNMTPCNNTLKYYSVIRLQLKLQKYLYFQRKLVGQKIEIVVKNNQFYLPYLKCSTNLKLL